MSRKTYHLKWSSHIPNMETVFTTLLESEGLCDVTLLCGQDSNCQALKAHRILLSTCSNFFLRLFLDMHAKVCVVSLPDISAVTMRALLTFIYTGEVSVEEEHAMNRLMGAAEALEIRGLTTDEHTSGNWKGDEMKDHYENKEADFVQAITKCRHLLDSSDMKKAHTLMLHPLFDAFHKNGVKNTRESEAEIVGSTCIRRKAAQSTPGKADPASEGGRRGSIDTESEEEDDLNDDEDTIMSSNNSHAYFNLDGANDAEGVRMQDMPQMPPSDHQLTATTAATAVDGKPFVCEICHAKFARASHLCRHRRTHTGEKPFECKKCGKLFSRQDKLKTHNDRHLANEGGTPIVIPRKKKKDKLKGQEPNQPLASKQQTQQQQIPAAQLLTPPDPLATASVSPSWNSVAFPGLANPLFATQLQQLQTQAPTASAIQLSNLVATLMANQRNQGQL